MLKTFLVDSGFLACRDDKVYSFSFNSNAYLNLKNAVSIKIIIKYYQIKAWFSHK